VDRHCWGLGVHPLSGVPRLACLACGRPPEGVPNNGPPDGAMRLGPDLRASSPAVLHPSTASCSWSRGGAQDHDHRVRSMAVLAAGLLRVGKRRHGPPALREGASSRCPQRRQGSTDAPHSQHSRRAPMARMPHPRCVSSPVSCRWTRILCKPRRKRPLTVPRGTWTTRAISVWLRPLK